METISNTSAPVHGHESIDFEAVKAKVLTLEIKPFATDHFWVGGWCIAAHACGYFMSSKSGYRFIFSEDGVDAMLDTLAGILAGTLIMVVYSTGCGGIWHKGEFRRCKVKKADTAGDYFKKALALCELDVKRYGEKSDIYGTYYVAVVAA